MKASRLINTVISSALVMAGCCICFNACKKDSAPVKDEVTAYVLDNLADSSIIISINEGDSVLGNTGWHIKESPPCIPAVLVIPARTDVEITASVDEDPRLGQVFDSIYKVNPPRLRPGMFTIMGNGKVTIKAGQTRSTDSIRVVLKDASSLKQPGTYIITVPVRLQVSSSNDRLKSSLVFVQYKVFVTDLHVSLSNDSSYNVSVFKDREQIPVNFTLSLSPKVNRDIQVELEAVTEKAFIDVYNLDHNTAYEPFPDGAYECPKTVTIPAGQRVSDFHFKLTDSSKLNPYSDYLLLLKLKDSTRAYKTLNSIYITAPKSRIDTSNTISRAGWKISGPGWRPTQNLLDGSIQTPWIFGSDGEVVITLDMGLVQHVRGFSFTPFYPNSIEWNPRTIEISSSNDGNSWKKECVYLGLPTSKFSTEQYPDIKTAWFPKAVSARYFRFNIPASVPRTSLSELNALK